MSTVSCLQQDQQQDCKGRVWEELQERKMLSGPFSHPPSQLFPCVAQGLLKASVPSSVELGWFNPMWSPLSDIIDIYVLHTIMLHIPQNVLQLQKQVKEGLKDYEIF